MGSTCSKKSNLVESVERKYTDEDILVLTSPKALPLQQRRQLHHQNQNMRLETFFRDETLSELHKDQLIEIESRRKVNCTLVPQLAVMDNYRVATFHIPDDDEYFEFAPPPHSPFYSSKSSRAAGWVPAEGATVPAVDWAQASQDPDVFSNNGDGDVGQLLSPHLLPKLAGAAVDPFGCAAQWPEEMDTDRSATPKGSVLSNGSFNVPDATHVPQALDPNAITHALVYGVGLMNCSITASLKSNLKSPFGDRSSLSSKASKKVRFSGAVAVIPHVDVVEAS